MYYSFIIINFNQKMAHKILKTEMSNLKRQKWKKNVLFL